MPSIPARKGWGWAETHDWWFQVLCPLCNTILFPMKLSRSQVCIPVQFWSVQRHPFQTFLHLTLTWNQFAPLDMQGEIRALQSGVLCPGFCNFWDWKNVPFDMVKRKMWGSLETFLLESVTADVHIHCQSWLTKWWESERVKNPIRNKVLGQVRTLYSQWLPSKCLLSGMERSFFNSGMVLSSGGATVPEINKIQHEDHTLCFCYRNS